MIIISGDNFDISTLINDYPVGSVERQLLQKMSTSGEKYRYDSLNDLKFELRLRNELINASRALDKSKFSFATFYDSRANNKYWNRTSNGGFRLKDGVKPSDAINDIFINGNLYATECASAMVIVLYKALLNVYGEALFNKTFDKIYIMNWHSLDSKIQEFGFPKKVKELLLGDRAYFDNPDVNPRTPEWQGENVIILPDGLYYGHGVGIGNAERIIRALNSNRRRNASRSAYLMDVASRPNYKKLAKIYYR